MNSDDTLEHADRNKCLQNYPQFKNMHNQLRYQKQIRLPVFHHQYQNQTAIKKETNRSQSQFFFL